MGVARLASVLLLAVLAASCQYAAKLNRQSLERYHNSRWQEVVAACAEMRDYSEPASPDTPRLAQDLEPLYAGIPAGYAATRNELVQLAAQSEESTQFVAEMLSVLSNRESTHIENLSAQIDSYFEQQEQAHTAWQAAFGAVEGAKAELRQRWDELLPDNGFSFDLASDIAELRASNMEELTETRQTALQQYYNNEYNRQAMVYLDYEPQDFNPLPKSHVPEGCAGLEAALRRQEAGLLVRYSLDTAINDDIDLVQRLARVDLSQTPWEDVKVPEGRYAEPRVAAAIARLKLLKYIDVLLSDSLDVFLYGVEQEWDKAWPGHNLETNIFRFAGVAERGTTGHP